MKRLKYIFVAVVALAAASCHYNDDTLKGQLNDIKARIAVLQPSIEAVNAQIEALRLLVSGNPVISASEDSDGNFVITYKDGNNVEKAVVVAGQDHMINVPVLGVRQDEKSKIYYWTITEKGETRDFIINGNPVPVSGRTPVVSVNTQGNWTVDGIELLDAYGNPIEAHNGETCVFRSVELKDNGDLEIVQGNGNVITIPIQNSLNFTLDCAAEVDLSGKVNPFVINYTLSGPKAADAKVSIAFASGVTPTLNAANKKVSVAWTSNSGTLVLMADDMAGHLVIRPVFFGPMSQNM